MLAQQRRQQVLNNNLSNMSTPGYKQDQGSMRAFPEMLIERMESKDLPTKNNLNLPVRSEVGSMNTGVYMQETKPEFEQAALRETGIGTDIALLNGNVPGENGGLFFTIQNEDGEARYTRNGNFTVDGEGFLTTKQGSYVLDQGGDPIQTGGVEFDVTEEGILEANGQAIPLGISYTNDATQMVKEGNANFSFNGEEGQAPVNARNVAGVTFNTRQGSLERSNVDPAKTMTEMMSSYRLFETNQKVLKAYDRSMDKAVNEIGRVR